MPISDATYRLVGSFEGLDVMLAGNFVANQSSVKTMEFIVDGGYGLNT